MSPSGDISFRYHEPITQRTGVSRDPPDDCHSRARPGCGRARRPVATATRPRPHADPRGAAALGPRSVRHHHPPARMYVSSIDVSELSTLYETRAILEPY